MAMFGLDVAKKSCNLSDCNAEIVWYALEKTINGYLKCEESIF